MSTERPRTNKKIIATLAVLVITVVIVFGVKALSNKQADAQPMATTTSAQSTTDMPPSTNGTSTANYTDGTYVGSGSYNSPGGKETIKVSITLTDNKVTNTSATSGAGDPTAQQFQDQFISGYKSAVVGKDISTIHLTHISGSSLTSQGFNDALQQIKSEAKA